MALVAMSLVASACASSIEVREQEPLTALMAWHEALASERPREAWNVLAPQAREGMTEADFLTLYAKDKARLIEHAKALVTWARSHPPSEAATVRVGQRHLRLIRVHDEWRIDALNSKGP